MSVFQTKGERKKLRNRILPWSTGDNYASTQVTLSSNMSRTDQDGWQVNSKWETKDHKSEFLRDYLVIVFGRSGPKEIWVGYQQGIG
ncbi:hypothetical protein PAAG_08568 [Paracoccidioides lutzii Pb01]|uniref:Uncharacterized protein n=1 Tax=Paracoccidioides lutzii (strain ATCC MYA-826 / Pb01) TaxID=502779 RepID=C1HCS7_PARBA|nr:hypothetical protein PAAG_08568 [Paracoccidioides lutzii Pb01]EEH38841.1 hypothetical protein PAAG_08568 [Paracoccidioides lutzii Pb01]